MVPSADEAVHRLAALHVKYHKQPCIVWRSGCFEHLDPKRKRYEEMRSGF